jgi:hypothetical protein
MNDERKTAGPDARLRVAMKARATIKLWIVTIAVTQLLAALFSWAADRLDSGSSMLPTLVFTFATSALVSRWLVIDAARAWTHACRHGHVRRGERAGQPTLEIAPDCPRRWLVKLHAGLNPGLVING